METTYSAHTRALIQLAGGSCGEPGFHGDSWGLRGAACFWGPRRLPLHRTARCAQSLRGGWSRRTRAQSPASPQRRPEPPAPQGGRDREPPNCLCRTVALTGSHVMPRPPVRPL